MQVGAINVRDEAEAEMLMLHHLHLATRYFEATHDDVKIVKALAREKMDEQDANAACAFIDSLDNYYKGLD